MIAAFDAVGSVAQAVLVAEFFLDLGIDFADGLLLGNFKHAGAGFLGDSLQHLLAIGGGLPRLGLRPGVTSAAPAPSAAAARPASPTSAVGFRVGEQNRVHHGIGTLRRFDRPLQRYAAGVVHPVGKNNESLPALLFADDLIGGEKNRVVERGAATASRTAARTAAACPGKPPRLLCIWGACSASSADSSFCRDEVRSCSSSTSPSK